MNFDAEFGCGMVLAVFAFGVLFWVQRMGRRRGKRFGFYPSSAALGNALQALQVFTRPSIQHVIEEKLAEEAQDDDAGEEELMLRELERQLRRIRRGEEVGRLKVPLWRR
jgi:hypothetical protein